MPPLSIAVQKMLLRQDTETRALGEAMPFGVTHDPPEYSIAEPALSTATQKVTEGHDTPVRASPSFDAINVPWDQLPLRKALVDGAEATEVVLVAEAPFGSAPPWLMDILHEVRPTHASAAIAVIR